MNNHGYTGKLNSYSIFLLSWSNKKYETFMKLTKQKTCTKSLLTTTKMKQPFTFKLILLFLSLKYLHVFIHIQKKNLHPRQTNCWEPARKSKPKFKSWLVYQNMLPGWLLWTPLTPSEKYNPNVSGSLKSDVCNYKHYHQKNNVSIKSLIDCVLRQQKARVM